jgi:hypothetical protein
MLSIVATRTFMRASPTVEYHVPIVHVTTVEALDLVTGFTFSETELFNTFARALYDTFNGEQNSAVIIKPDGGQVRIYDYDASQTYVRVDSIGVHFGFEFKIDETCQMRAYVQGVFAFHADLNGIVMRWRTDPYAQLDPIGTWCQIADGIPFLNDYLFGGADQDVSTGVRGRIEDAVRGALPATGGFQIFLQSAVTSTDQLTITVLLPEPSVTINVPYDVFDSARTATVLPADATVMLLASGLATRDHVFGEASNVYLQSGPNGVPRAGTANWAGARTVARSGALVWDGVPVSRMLAHWTTPQSAVMTQYSPGCTIQTASSPLEPTSVRFGVNDTAADAYRLRYGHYSLRMFFYDVDPGGRCRPRPSDVPQTPIETGR